MKKTIIAIAATGYMGAVLLAPTPAAAFFIPFMVLEAKKDKNFKAVNPYETKKVAKKGKKKR